MNSAEVSATSQISAKYSSRSARRRPGWAWVSPPNAIVPRASSGNSTAMAMAMTIVSGASTSRRISRGGSTATPRWPGSGSGEPGQVGRGCSVGALDADRDLRPVPVAQLGQIGRPAVAAGREHVHPHPVRDGGDLLVEPVPPGDLERDQADLPGPARHGQRALYPAHVQHVDGGGAERYGPAGRDRVDQAAVEEMLAADLDRRK